MSESIFLAMFLTAMRLSTPLALGAFGGYFSERAGIVNIALEGLMLIGAFCSAAIAHATGNPWLGLVGGIAGGTILAFIHAVISIDFGADQIISGIAVNLLAAGVPPVICKVLYDMTGGTPLLENSARFSTVFGLSPLVLLTAALAVVLYFVHKSSVFGQYIRFAGEHPQALQSQGVSVRKTRYAGVLLSGVFCGVAGTYLAVDHGGGFTRNMTAGRGYIALAALIIGRWTPLGGFIAALIFGTIETSQILLQGMKLPNGSTIPVQWIQMIPYFSTLLILAGLLGKRFGKTKPPSAIGKPVFMLVFCSFLLSGCKLIDQVQGIFHKEKLREVGVAAIEDTRKVNAEFLKEVYRDTLLRDITQEEFESLLNALDQGAHYEGVYNGIVYSKEYKAKETGHASAGAVKMYAELMTALEVDRKIEELKNNTEKEKPDVIKPEDEKSAPTNIPDEERQAIQKNFENQGLELSGYELKRRVGEELILVADLKKDYREKLSSWFGKFAKMTCSYQKDFGLVERNHCDEYTYYKWALNSDVDRVKWEALHRIHVLFNSVF